MDSPSSRRRELRRPPKNSGLFSTKNGMVALASLVVLLWTFFVYYMTRRGMIHDIYEQSRGRGKDSLYRLGGRSQQRYVDGQFSMSGDRDRGIAEEEGEVDQYQSNAVADGYTYSEGVEDSMRAGGIGRGGRARGVGSRTVRGARGMRGRKSRRWQKRRPQYRQRIEGEIEDETNNEEGGEEIDYADTSNASEESSESTENYEGGEEGAEMGEEVASTEEEQGEIEEESSEAASFDDDDLLHIVFSTECSEYQDWQSMLLMYSAWSVGQKGTITRIASGCDETKQQELTQIYADLYPSNSVHFVPNYREAEEYKLIEEVRQQDPNAESEYRFFNKPYSIKHWLENMENPLDNGTIIALIDPDMIFLRPLTHKIKEENVIFMQSYIDNGLDQEPPEKVQQGQPAGQLYGLGSSWTVAPQDFVDDYGNKKKGNFNRTDICGPSSPCNSISAEEVDMYYAIGPPYIIEISDLTRLSQVWLQFLPKVYSGYPELLAEMYAYSMAASDQQLPHYTLQHYMVSNTEIEEEGWAWIDALEDGVCEPTVDGIYFPDNNMPTFLHYCQMPRAGEFVFNKWKITDRIFDCDAPLLQELPLDLSQYNYKMKDGRYVPEPNNIEARRNSFLLCTLYSSINTMLTDYKMRYCPEGANYNASVNLATENYNY